MAKKIIKPESCMFCNEQPCVCGKVAPIGTREPEKEHEDG